jgi:hypothetical protein
MSLWYSVRIIQELDMKAIKCLPVLLSLLISTPLFAGTTGKIAGIVTDAQSGEKLLAANVTVEGLSTGAATNVDGFYAIVNVPPGTYRVRASLVGYTSVTQVEVRVELDQTTTLNFKLAEESVQGQEVVITAQRPVVQRDISASRANLEIAEVERLPVTTVSSAISLQAGVQNTATGPVIRGSTPDQASFQVDGLTLRDGRTNLPYTGVALSAVQDVQVQTGGFNAEYGNLRSGIVNVITKEGDKSAYSISFNGRYANPRPKHFGPSIYDKNSYWIRPYVDPAVAWTGTKNGAWDGPTQQQYASFQGWNAVSQATMKDPNPANHLSPTAAQQVFLWEYRKQADINIPDYDFDAGLGGPFPGGEALGNMRFFAAYKQSQSAYVVPLSTDAYRNYNGQLRVTSDITPTIKLLLEGLMGRTTGTNNNNAGTSNAATTSSISPNNGVFTGNPTDITDLMANGLSYIDSRIFSTDYWAPTTIDYKSGGAKLTQMVGKETFYDASIFVFQSKYSTNPAALRNQSPILSFGNGYLVDMAPFGYEPAPSTGITGLRMGVGMSNSRDSSKVTSYTAKFDMTSQLDRINQFKAGFEWVLTDDNINYASVDAFLPAGGRYWVKFHTFPKRGGAYIQDKLEFEGMVANIGVRLDYLDPSGTWYSYTDPYNAAFSGGGSAGIDTLIPQVRVKRQWDVSPRVGIAFPISEDAKLYFNYGHMRSLPAPDNIFLYRSDLFTHALLRISDPNTPAPRTIAYELGYEQNLFDMFLVRVAAYYKDITDEPYPVTYVSTDGSISYSTTTSNEYRDIRGFEVTVDKKRGNWVQGFINYTYDVRTNGHFGFSTYYQNTTTQANFELTNPVINQPIPQPYARANIYFFTPPELGPALGPISALGDWRLDVIANWQSGFYFTWAGGGGASIPGVQNNLQWRDYYDVDLRISKNFKIGKLNLQFYMDMYNVLNLKYMSQDGFVLGSDFDAYIKSLHLPAFPGTYNTQLGYNNIPGSDRPGDYRTVPYEPYDPNDPSPSHKKYVLDNKAYIVMPNQQTFAFLNPAQYFFGLHLSYDI